MKPANFLFCFLIAALFICSKYAYAQEESVEKPPETSIELPVLLEQSLKLYSDVNSYQDSVSMILRMKSDMMDTKVRMEQNFAYERPNKLRYASSSNMMSMGEETYCDGEKYMHFMKPLNQYTEEEAPDTINTTDLSSMQNILAREIIVSGNLLENFKRGISSIEKGGEEEIGGVFTERIDVTRTAGSFGIEFNTSEEEKSFHVVVSFWIGKKDKLVRKISYALNMDELLKTMSEQEQSQLGSIYKGMTMEVTEEHLSVKINPEFSDFFFKYDPPEGAKKTENFGLPSAAEDEKSGLTDKPAPEFSLKDLDGNEVSLSDFRGKVVLVDFWATWCGPCLRAMPHMQTLWDIYKNENVVILGINSWERAPDKIESVLEERKITYSILLDEDNEVVGKYGVRGIPTFFIVDKEGVVKYSYTGMPAERQVIQENIEELLR